MFYARPIYLDHFQTRQAYKALNLKTHNWYLFYRNYLTPDVFQHEANPQEAQPIHLEQKTSSGVFFQSNPVSIKSPTSFRLDYILPFQWTNIYLENMDTHEIKQIPPQLLSATRHHEPSRKLFFMTIWGEERDLKTNNPISLSAEAARQNLPFSFHPCQQGPGALPQGLSHQFIGYSCGLFTPWQS